jgi:hypothetical protein
MKKTWRRLEEVVVGLAAEAEVGLEAEGWATEEGLEEAVKEMEVEG